MSPRPILAEVPRRPLPPAELAQVQTFAPAPELEAWLRAVFLEEDGPLANPDHGHLRDASLGVLWAGAPATRHGRRILGQAEFQPPVGTGSAWAKARQVQQLEEWFGQVPDFLLTFDASIAAELDDPAFCALVEHELYHCAQARDEFGGLRFSRTTGLPVFCLRGHDVEEFVGVVRRYGAAAAGVSALVEAARGQPAVAPAAIAGACGTCLARAA